MASLMHCTARSLSRYLRENGVSMNDFMGVRRVRRPERIQPRLRFEDFAALQRAVGDRLSRASAPRRRLFARREDALVRFLADTGLRAMEVCALDMGDVDLERGLVVVQQGKGRKPRMLSIWDPDRADGGATITAVGIYLDERAARLEYMGYTTEAFWIGGHGRRLSPASLRAALKQLCIEAGLDANRPPHAFRRGWFTESYKQDPRALPVLAARMGWGKHYEPMAVVYTRGAELDFAAEPRPLLSSRWERQASATG